jgi:pimeloyl-ACP methyl ester carboxylesterase
MSSIVKRAMIGIAGLLLFAVATGATYELHSRRKSGSLYPAPGRLIDIGGGRRIQMDCRGSGSPTVVLESGLDAYGSLAWMMVHDSIAATTRVCAYSRAGIMWSDPTTESFDVAASARDLHTALIAAGESAPWVMVGHSLGGPYVTTFTAMYGSEVAGLVFVDITHPDQFTRWQAATGKWLMPSASQANIGSALAWTGLLRFIPAVPKGSSWPQQMAEASNAFFPKSLSRVASEMNAIPATIDAMRMNHALGDRPLIVLNAARGNSPAELAFLGLSADQEAKRMAVKTELQADLAKWSSNGRMEVVANASHYIQLDRPDVVIAAVREVVARGSNHVAAVPVRSVP